MNLCSHKHDEVCYEGTFCPCCIEMEDRDDKIRELEEKITELEEPKSE